MADFNQFGSAKPSNLGGPGNSQHCAQCEAMLSDALDGTLSATDQATFDGEDDSPTMADRLADPRPSQEQHVAGLELKIRVQHALKQLSPELREAVILRDLEDMDYKEISQVLRIPEGTVKSRISRGRGELARLLQRIENQVR